ncbi:hypothetical protein TNIN_127541 [Trichonephila inaurata madagascariensis]|uniref:Uncharacterized protein n=1 Tax=Trichonephila inaurata madagascariensis TaxID=2747483 RepID=A0A8X6XG45_9ARAC|nr:hypothetical protein TNIN_127541 [Trichonephila inaurata madagascariensis]
MVFGTARGVTIGMRVKLTYRQLLKSLVFIEPPVLVHESGIVVVDDSVEVEGPDRCLYIFDYYSKFLNVLCMSLSLSQLVTVGVPGRIESVEEGSESSIMLGWSEVKSMFKIRKISGERENQIS